jgi:hypothetical protein
VVGTIEKIGWLNFEDTYWVIQRSALVAVPRAVFA